MSHPGINAFHLLWMWSVMTVITVFHPWTFCSQFNPFQIFTHFTLFLCKRIIWLGGGGGVVQGMSSDILLRLGNVVYSETWVLCSLNLIFLHSLHIFIGPTKTSIQSLLILWGIHRCAFCQISQLYVQVELKQACCWIYCWVQFAISSTGFIYASYSISL